MYCSLDDIYNRCVFLVVFLYDLFDSYQSVKKLRVLSFFTFSVCAIKIEGKTGEESNVLFIDTLNTLITITQHRT